MIDPPPLSPVPGMFTNQFEACLEDMSRLSREMFLHAGNQPNDPFGFAAAPSGPSPAPSKPSKASGGSVQALSPNLVPKTSNPKKDPFADLFS